MTKKELIDIINILEPAGKEMCYALWTHPEPSGMEAYASDRMRSALASEGFKIINNEHLPYAFYAEYGSGKPVIALLGEYDALPALSQQICDYQNPVVDGGPGHGCGHNLLGTGQLLAAIAVKRFLEQEKISGTVRFYGCPEEEMLCGKVKMAYYHMFDDCDFAMSWHPNDSSMVFEQAYLASSSAHFNFKGKTSHAAFAPELGRSALDAVELMNVGANYLREHVVDRSRIHYTTDSGGFAPNIVPDHAGSWYFVRAPKIKDVKNIMERLGKIAEGAALMTETKASMKVDYGCCEYRGTKAFADLTYKNMLEIEHPVYTLEELDFAAKIQASLSPAVLEGAQKAYGQEDGIMHEGVAPREFYREKPMNASSDSGDVSYMLPMNLFVVDTWPMGVSPHTWQSCAVAGTSIGQKGAMYAAKILAGTAYDLLTQPEVANAITQEFEQMKEPYTPMYEV